MAAACAGRHQAVPPDAVDDKSIPLPQPGFPSAAVAPDGSVYVAFEDNNPTDLRTAPLPAHNYVGEYQGLAALPGRGFAAIFTMAAPLAKNGPTDIFFARIGPG